MNTPAISDSLLELISEYAEYPELYLVKNPQTNEIVVEIIYDEPLEKNGMIIYVESREKKIKHWVR